MFEFFKELPLSFKIAWLASVLAGLTVLTLISLALIKYITH